MLCIIHFFMGVKYLRMTKNTCFDVETNATIQVVSMFLRTKAQASAYLLRFSSILFQLKVSLNCVTD